MPNKFNIRVYGLLINSKKEILLSDEQRGGLKFTKFPGGGLEWGEGIADCLIREFKEELNQKIIIKQHFYTTDFFQESAFDKTQQLISHYYIVEVVNKYQFETTEKAFDLKPGKDGMQCFRWISIDSLTENDLTFPIDKIVGKQLKLYYF